MQQFSSPQEIEQAEEEAQEKREEEESREQEEEEESPSGEHEEEEQEESPSGEQEEGGEEESGSEEEEGEEISGELDDLLQDHGAEPVEEEPEEEEEDLEQEESEEEVSEYEPMELDITNDRFEEITSDPESFQEFIEQVQEDTYKRTASEFEKRLNEREARIKEEILQNVPKIVQKTAERAQSVKSLRNQFFEQNPSLKDKMGYVRDVTNAVSHQHPDWSAKQVLNEVAERAKRDLNLSEQAEEREEQRNSGPKFAGAGGRRNPGGGSDNRGKQEKLLDDTFNQ